MIVTPMMTINPVTENSEVVMKSTQINDTITHRIHVYANIGGIFMGSMAHHI